AMGGMVVAFIVILVRLPEGVSFVEAVSVAGKLGKLNAIDFSFDWENRYTFWSGVIGGLFLQLSYFGTDQSQVQRYLTGKSVAESRIALLFNGMVKVPMQFFILFVGAMVFVFYQFVQPPVFFNPIQTERIQSSDSGEQYAAIEARHAEVFAAHQAEARRLVQALRADDEPRVNAAAEALRRSHAEVARVRGEAIALMQATDPKTDTNDTNYVFLTFVMRYLPVGLVGLVIAAVFAASMSSTSSELNALASTTVVDLYKRLVRKDGSDAHMVLVSKLATVFWGIFAIGFAMVANRLGTLVEAVNILGSLFYGTILGIFLVGFYMKWVRGTATFAAALVAEAIVIYCKLATPVAWLWYNVIGCVAVVVLAVMLQSVMRPRETA
ncbi:MAG TPA: sodium:solute symporter, partial [Thermoanaerobaculia bacterium]|nr:sodium:solute symporter [Thermoanaerobaculia bacterium]